MKLNRLCCAALSAALLTGLCACAPTGPVGDNPSADVRGSAQPSPTSRVPDASKAPSEGSAAPESAPPSFAQYDRDHRLNVPVPELIDGLEMPVIGATGYTSVSLPLWPSIPAGPKPSPSPSPSQPEPSPSEPPAASQPPEPSPGETPEPAPEETPGPAPDETPGPAPDETPEPVPDETPEPTPEQPPEITPEPVPPEMPDPAATQVYATALVAAPKPAGALSSYTNAAAVWEPGAAFTILEENGGWWRVSRGNETGWIEHRYCMINLPDVIPSMIYDDVNAYSSLFASCGKDIPGVTGAVFYHSLVYNVRLDRQEFVMPILYSAARNICAAQHRALEEGNCLVVYQTFRPYDTQTAVADGLTQLANVDPEVRAGTSASPWGMDWFISAGVSGYQQGYALDVSMVKVYAAEERYIGTYPYLYATGYEAYRMPTAMHELSIAAASALSPGSGQLSQTMNEPAIALRNYCVSSGLSPLDSQWWQFSDPAAMQAASANPSDGRYTVTECLSRAPEWVSRSSL